MVKRICQVCGKTFNVKPAVIRRGGGKYCSRECRKKRAERKCQICGKTFYVTLSVTRKANSGKYCSKACHNLSMRGRKKDAWVEIKCHGCGKLFIAPRYRKEQAMFCSRECTRTRFEKKCEICGKNFYNEPNREKIGRGKYCSKTCFNLSQKGKHLTQEHINKIVTGRQKSLIKKPKLNKICEYCKNKFLADSYDTDRVYCSHRCYSLAKKGKASKQKGILRPDDTKYWTTKRQNLLRDSWTLKSKKEILDLFPSKPWSALLNQVHYMKVKRNFEIPKRPPSDVAVNVWNHQKEIVEQYRQRQSAPEIARKFNVESGLIRTILIKNGIKIRTNAEAQTMRLYDNPEALKSLAERGIKSRTPYLYTLRGEMVYSKGEQEIANFLYKHKIEYELNKPLKLGNKLVVPDFWLPTFKVFIEFWGFQGAFGYDERMKVKQELYKKYNVPLIEITSKDYNKKRIPKILLEQLQVILDKD